MKYSVQVDNIGAFNEALASDCDRIRFGSEFCEWKIPSSDLLKEAYLRATSEGKEFAYITPAASDKSLEKIREQASYLDSKGVVTVIVNDLGVLNLVEEHSNLKPHLGRQLVMVPARTPWDQITEYEVGYLQKQRVSKVFNQTSMNYEPTIQFYEEHGVKGVDLDWIPNCFSSFDFLSENGLIPSVYLYLVPISITRRCNMARFLGETDPETCSRPCYTTALLLRQKRLQKVELFLHDSGVFRLTQPSRKDLDKLYRSKVAEFIISMNPLTKVETREDINRVIQALAP